MALPPLELFSLKKKPPCCRVASSHFRLQLLGDKGEENLPKRETDHEKFFFEREARPRSCRCSEHEERYSEGKRHSMSHALPAVLQVTIAIFFLAILILPNDFAHDADFDVDDRNRNHIP